MYLYIPLESGHVVNTGIYNSGRCPYTPDMQCSTRRAATIDRQQNRIIFYRRFAHRGVLVDLVRFVELVYIFLFLHISSYNK